MSSPDRSVDSFAAAVMLGSLLPSVWDEPCDRTTKHLRRRLTTCGRTGYDRDRERQYGSTATAQQRFERIGFFFAATRWSGEPVNREPEKCLGLEWFSVHELPEDIIEYPEKGLLGYLEGAGALTEHGWE
ncbi:hypothetical protein [Streptomyces sp. NBC_00059]|uniref:hypothetical protein n=1 Tax=Streptomyces sp. NBC_00059 TaxID=2975635 RepID=UPI0022543C41|nr:hypothetical protein [Streptomyces sp. NBC_00059]MCX5416063.1 hypothetical protein [Streptomyces sp. NBC_00059]